ncbi:hypothetical protein O0L34_g12497 [Tuta absoluta]|nr:hypothetical protein O0L34_g12497 [Tuta absoluta]
MLFRNVWCAADLTSNFKTCIIRQRLNRAQSGFRIQCRNSFHNARGRRPGLQPDPLECCVETGPLHSKNLFRPFLFTIGVSTASLVGCVIWEYENLRKHVNIFSKPGTWHKKVWAQYQRREPGPIQKWWNTLREYEKVFYPILIANVLVFAAWRVPALQPTMVKYFCSNPAGRAVCLPMLLSTFSHYSPLHLAANMYVLYSFMPGAVAALGKEQFVAMYLSAGVVSSFASFLYKVAMNQPGLSLGASGAIMAVLSYVCVQYPDTKLSIIFLPMYTFAAGSAIKVIMGIDLAGVILGWKFFDHAAHLGGALFGIGWCYWGGTHIWGNRDKLLQYYHNVRSSGGNR